MDNPYRGEVSVTPDAFREAYRIMVADAGPSSTGPTRH
jgi:hypothetical protein